MESVDILGVKVNLATMDQAVETVTGWLQQTRIKRKRYIVTPNPEFIIAAKSDPEFKKILNGADLSIPDGVGLKLASNQMRETVAGVDLMEQLCQMAAIEGFTVGLLGGRNGVASQTAKRLQKLYPKLKITIAEDGPELTGINSSESLSARGPAAPVSQVRPRGLTSHAAVDSRDLSSASPLGISIPPTDILFVAFGQVKQEKWITENLSEIPVKVAMGVGGAFDYISGRVPRAPIWMRRLGLEWLFRLITQPWRIRRQMVLLKFAWLTFTKKA